MRFYKSLQKLTKATIFHDIFSVKSLAFMQFRLIAMYFLHFIILYCDKRNFSVCYCTVSPLDNIGKYFAIIKQQVIFPISQILNYNTEDNDIKHNCIQHNATKLTTISIRIPNVTTLNKTTLSKMMLSTQHNQRILKGEVSLYH